MGTARRGRVGTLVCALLFWVGGSLPRLLAEGSEMPPPSSETVKQELVTVVDAQLAAFREGDFARAYSFAAGGIRTMFAQEDFERMVKTGYPAIARSRSADYGLAFDTGEEAVLNVRVVGAGDGRSVSFQYTLEKEDGVWKITGVSELRDTSLNV